MSEKGKKPEPVTLTDEDIVSSKGREVGRRSMVGMLGVGAAAGAVALATGCRRAVVVRTVATGITDGDGGACADPAGGGRGNTGVTDADQHPCYDPPGRGRAVGGQVVVQQPVQQRVIVQQPGVACTDSDPHDAAGRGVRCAGGVRVQVGGRSGITDSDGGPCADPAGSGRGVTGLTDSDAGGCADPAGRGRRGN
jgi:hypothetical protein